MPMIENMSKRTKIILSCVGIGAVVVPVVLLLLISGQTRQVPEVPKAKRPLDTKSLENTAKKTVPANIILPSSPIPSASSSASPATSSAR